jgi:hypothetical protein
MAPIPRFGRQKAALKPQACPKKLPYFVLCKALRLCYTLRPADTQCRLFLGSSAVEHSTVNRMVAGSNPARGAKNQSSAPSSNDRPIEITPRMTAADG